MLASLMRPVTDFFERWATSRRPKGTFIELNQSKIFIFPTAAGWSFLLLCIVIFLVGTNYQNNLIQTVSFFLISLGILSIHYTYLNLSGLQIKILRGFNCYAEDQAEFHLQLGSTSRRNYQGLMFSWKEGGVRSAEVNSGESQDLHLYARTYKRGRFVPGPLLVETRFPFGLLRAWSWMEPEIEVLVYPKPLKVREPQFNTNQGDGEQTGKEDFGEDFSGLEDYQPGDSTRRIAWKQFAQGRGLLTKKYIGSRDKKIWLSLEEWPDLSTEQKLSGICYWAQQFEHQNIDYGLLLPNTTLAPNSGPRHLEQIMIALAKAPSRSVGGD